MSSGLPLPFLHFPMKQCYRKNLSSCSYFEARHFQSKYDCSKTDFSIFLLFLTFISCAVALVTNDHDAVTQILWLHPWVMRSCMCCHFNTLWLLSQVTQYCAFLSSTTNGSWWIINFIVDSFYLWVVLQIPCEAKQQHINTINLI